MLKPSGAAYRSFGAARRRQRRHAARRRARRHDRRRSFRPASSTCTRAAGPTWTQRAKLTCADVIDRRRLRPVARPPEARPPSSPPSQHGLGGHNGGGEAFVFTGERRRLEPARRPQAADGLFVPATSARPSRSTRGTDRRRRPDSRPRPAPCTCTPAPAPPGRSRRAHPRATATAAWAWATGLALDGDTILTVAADGGDAAGRATPRAPCTSSARTGCGLAPGRASCAGPTTASSSTGRSFVASPAATCSSGARASTALTPTLRLPPRLPPLRHRRSARRSTCRAGHGVLVNDSSPAGGSADRGARRRPHRTASLDLRRRRLVHVHARAPDWAGDDTFTYHGRATAPGPRTVTTVTVTTRDPNAPERRAPRTCPAGWVNDARDRQALRQRRHPGAPRSTTGARPCKPVEPVEQLRQALHRSRRRARPGTSVARPRRVRQREPPGTRHRQAGHPGPGAQGPPARAR